MHRILTPLFPLVLFLSLATQARAQAPIVPGDVLVMLRPGVEAKAVADDLARVHGMATGARVEREVSAPMRAWLYRFDPQAIGQAAMVRAFQAHPGVQLAQNNHVIEERQTTPDDPLFTQQWWHQNIQSELAWDITTGGVTATGDTIVVAIIEQADLAHPDLSANAWTNRAEIPGNGIDDDGNGYVDDVRGWNPQSGNDQVYSGSHGTQVAGMIGATGNNDNQVAGANWHVKMMPVHYRNTQEANVIESYTYPLVMRRLYNSSGGARGAFVVATNASWGVDGGQPSEAPLWCAMYDTLGAAGVLNCGSTTNNNVDVDQVGDLPTACSSDFMISVTATNSQDMRTFSGYGATTVDLGAPGQSVLTTSLGGGTGTPSGTSFASPLTAGVIALMYSVPCPSLAALAHNDPVEAALRVRQALFAGVDHVGNLAGQTVTGGRINAYNSVQILMDSCEACPTPYNLSASSDAIGSATVNWSAMPGTYTLRYRPQGSGTWTVLPGLSGNSLDLSGLATCQAYEFQMAADCGEGQGDFGPSFFYTSEGCCTAPLSITAQAVDTTGANITWSTVLASDTYDLRYREVGAADWTELSALTGNSTAITGLDPCSDIEIQMGSTCAGDGSGWSASVVLHIPGCGQCLEGVFCTSKGGTTAYEWIALVEIGDINRPSGSDGGYAGVDVTGQSTDLRIGDSYSIHLLPGYSWFAYQESFTVWIDLDRNGQFTPDELMYQGTTNSTSQPLDGTVVVPANATPGPARMRVLMKDSSPASTGCLMYDYGETEDYCVNLVDPTSGVAQVEHPGAALPYPQPADQVLHLSLPLSGTMQARVVDMTGRTVADQAFSGGMLTLNTAPWGAGMYVYHIVREGNVVARGSFVVAH